MRPSWRTVVASAAGLAIVTAVGGGCGLAGGHGESSRSQAGKVSKQAVVQGAPQSNPAVPVTPSTSPGASSSTTTAPVSATTPSKKRAPAHHHATGTAVTHLNLSKFGTGPTTTAAPTAIAIPSIGVQTTLVKLGRNADGTAQVPDSVRVAGWYDQGPAPGQRGPAVILGHVDSLDDPGVFFKLKDLVAGETVLVTEQGKQLTFEVQRVAIYSKAQFPTEAVYGPTPARALRLITCGGPFDYSTGHYYDNVVVYAVEVTA